MLWSASERALYAFAGGAARATNPEDPWTESATFAGAETTRLLSAPGGLWATRADDTQ